MNRPHRSLFFFLRWMEETADRSGGRTLHSGPDHSFPRPPLYEDQVGRSVSKAYYGKRQKKVVMHVQLSSEKSPLPL